MVPTTDATVDLPALNSQFTSETLTITGCNSYFGPNADQITWYLADGTFGTTARRPLDQRPRYGDLLVNGTPPGPSTASTTAPPGPRSSPARSSPTPRPRS